jgi:hypothetical protein
VQAVFLCKPFIIALVKNDNKECTLSLHLFFFHVTFGICTSKDKANHQVQTLGQLGDITHCHLSDCPPHFRPALLQHTGGFLNKTTNLFF